MEKKKKKAKKKRVQRILQSILACFQDPEIQSVFLFQVSCHQALEKAVFQLKMKSMNHTFTLRSTSSYRRYNEQKMDTFLHCEKWLQSDLIDDFLNLYSVPPKKWILLSFQDTGTTSKDETYILGEPSDPDHYVFDCLYFTEVYRTQSLIADLFPQE